jgi:glycosyltransferase involved in cell wall biosynthesis
VKVLHVIGSVSQVRGGPSFVVSALARGLAARGIEVHVATTDDDGPGRRLHVPTGTPVQEEGVVYWHFRRQTRFYGCSFALAKWLWLHVSKYDLVHIHALFNFSSSVAAWTAAAHGIPYIVRPLGVLNRWGFNNRHPALKRLSLRFVESGVLRRAATIHYTSEQERSEAPHVDGLPESVIIANPASLPNNPKLLKGRFRAQYPGFANCKLILFLSRVDQKKGLDLLLAAFAHVRKSCTNVALVVAGSGEKEYMNTLQNRARSLGIAHDVIWTGFLNMEQKAAALADSDIFVLPSYSENFGLAVIEAMAFEVPVVVSDQVAIHREIARAEAGVVVPCDARALGAAISTLLASPHAMIRVAKNARFLLANEFSSRVILDKLVSAYESVLRKVATPVLI